MFYFSLYQAGVNDLYVLYCIIPTRSFYYSRPVLMIYMSYIVLFQVGVNDLYVLNYIIPGRC